MSTGRAATSPDRPMMSAMASLARPQLPRTAEAIAASELRAAIVRGELAPGAKILQEATAQELGISLIPLREALKTLASEGIVTYEPQRGYFVTDLQSERIDELYALRDLLEAEAERIAVGRLNAEAIELMGAQLRVQERAVAERDAVEMIAANRVFHFTLFERCENPWLLRFVAQLWDALDPYRVLSYRRMWLQDDERLIPDEILAEHRQVLAALQRGEHEPALQLLREHRKRSRDFVVVLSPADPVSR
jgi:DNA-binding GntR family transcriptional regulator